MSAWKYTMLFDYRSNLANRAKGGRQGGWSESWYSLLEPGDFEKTAFAQLQTRRAGLLGTGARIVGQRYQQVDPSGRSSTGQDAYPAASGMLSDQPQTSLLFRVPSADTTNFKGFICRGIPDDMVKEGEYIPTQAFTSAINLFFTNLGGWRFRAEQANTPQADINSITVTGTTATVALDTSFDVSANTKVKITRCYDTFGRVVSGTFRYSPTDTFHGTIQNWTHGVCTGGRIRVFNIIYPLVQGVAPTNFRAIVRKVGRPLIGYRGRASKRS